MAYHAAWKIVYAVYPPILRVLESLRIHNERQPFLLGTLRTDRTSEELRRYLLSNGYEDAVLAWKDTDEIFSLRKVHDTIFQYHIRLHSDGEVRGHYEYSSEGDPIKHIVGTGFRPEKDYFDVLLGEYVIAQTVN